MKWFIKANSIVLYFYILLILSILILTNYYLVCLLAQIVNIKLLLLIMAITSGIGTWIVLNSTINTIKKTVVSAKQGNFLYKNFALIIINICVGTLLVIPGVITTITGCILHIKPIRLFFAHLLYKYKEQHIINLYSYFLAEYL